MIVMVTGSCFYAYGITSVITSMTGTSEHERRLRAQRDQLNRYLTTMEVPRELRQKLREYFVYYTGSADVFNERAVLAMLSPGLRMDLTSLAKAPLLRKVSFFKEVDEQCVTELAQLLQPNLYVPDEVIIRMHQFGKEMYVIKNGSVTVYLKDVEGGRNVLATLVAGNFFGEGALLRGTAARRGAYVAAVTYSLIYSLHVEEMNEMLLRYPSVMDTITAIGAHREAETKRKQDELGDVDASFKKEEQEKLEAKQKLEEQKKAEQKSNGTHAMVVIAEAPKAAFTEANGEASQEAATPSVSSDEKIAAASAARSTAEEQLVEAIAAALSDGSKTWMQLVSEGHGPIMEKVAARLQNQA